MTKDEVRDLTAFRISHDADVTCPDSLDSPGAQFLTGIASAVCEAIAWEQDNNDLGATEDDLLGWAEDGIHEIADSAVPIYTGDKWATFVDLAAYHEELDDLGGSTGDMDQDASTALYIIAERVAQTVVAMLAEDDDDDDDPS